VIIFSPEIDEVSDFNETYNDFTENHSLDMYMRNTVLYTNPLFSEKNCTEWSSQQKPRAYTCILL
jgi:hypothetical protein